VIIKVEFWQLVMLLLSFLGFCGVVGKLLLDQIDRRLNVKFTAQEESRVAGDKAINDTLKIRFAALEEARRAGDEAIHDTLKAHIAEESKNSGQLLELERQLLNWKADLPLQYVRREDFIRNQTIIESKLDGLALRFENAILKGGSNA